MGSLLDSNIPPAAFPFDPNTMEQQPTRSPLAQAEFHEFLCTNPILRSRYHIQQAYDRLYDRILENSDGTSPAADLADALFVSKASKAARKLEDFCVARFAELMNEQIELGSGDVRIQPEFVNKIWFEVRGLHGWNLDSTSDEDSSSVDREDATCVESNSEASDGSDNLPPRAARVENPEAALGSAPQDNLPEQAGVVLNGAAPGSAPQDNLPQQAGVVLNGLAPIFDRARNNFIITWVFGHIFQTIMVSILLCGGLVLAIRTLTFIWHNFLHALWWSLVDFFLPVKARWFVWDFGVAGWGCVERGANHSRVLGVAGLSHIGTAANASAMAVTNTVTWIGLSTASFFNLSFLFSANSSINKHPARVDIDILQPRDTIASEFESTFEYVFGASNISIQILPAIAAVGHAENLIIGAADLVATTNLTFRAELKQAYYKLEHDLKKAGKSMRRLSIESEIVLTNIESYLRWIINSLNDIRNLEESGFFERLVRYLVDGDPFSTSEISNAQLQKTRDIFLAFLENLLHELNLLLELFTTAENDIVETGTQMREVQKIERQNDEQIVSTQSSLAAKESASRANWLPWRQSLSPDDQRQANLMNHHRLTMKSLHDSSTYARQGVIEAKQKVEQAKDDIVGLREKVNWYLGPMGGRSLDTAVDMQGEVHVFTMLAARVADSSGRVRTAREWSRDLSLGRFESCRGLGTKEWDACFFGPNYGTAIPIQEPRAKKGR